MSEVKIDGSDGLNPDQGGTHVLIIDPQVDFHTGSLAVPGANEDVKRYSNMILDHIYAVSKIHVTLDTHQKMDCGHAIFWKNKSGNHPEPFTIITAEEIEKGEWLPVRPELTEHCIKYAKGLESGGRHKVTIWPEHCLVGTPGHNISPVLQHALQRWHLHTRDVANHVFKGTNPLTEMYSALRADYEIESDPSTQTNFRLIEQLKRADRVLVCGEAKSHCVNYTVRDLIKHWPADRMKDIWILEDGMSSVVGFEEAGDKFLEDMRAAGLTITKCELAFN